MALFLSGGLGDFSNAIGPGAFANYPRAWETPSFSFPPLSDASKTAATGAKIDDKFAGQIIGKDNVIFVGGQVLFGCRICEGPFLRDVDGAGFVDMIVTCAMAAVPGATREIRYLNLNGTKTFESSDGGETWDVVAGATTSVFDDVAINVLYGTETQTPLASSISRYGARAVPYRSQICIELKNIPLAPFANVIPFVSAYVYQDAFLMRNEGLRRLANFARFSDAELDIEVSGHDTFWIVAQQSSFMEYLQGLQRTLGRNWNIVPSDKLRITETPSTVVPITITRDDFVEDTGGFNRVDPLSVPAIRTMGFIDTGRDNDFGSVKAVKSLFPIALTASEDTENLDIPIGMDSDQAKEIVNRSLLIDDVARNQFSCRLVPRMRGIVPGDVLAPSAVDAGVDGDLFRVTRVARRAADWTIEAVVEKIERSLLPPAPSITSNGGAATASIIIDEFETAVTTVTAGDADEEGAFSISGGDDAAFFEIDPDTGVLSFIDPPEYEVPQDADANNTYIVIVEVTGNGLKDHQTITVAVANIAAATILMAADTSLSAQAQILRPGLALLSGAAVLAASAQLRMRGSAALAGSSALASDATVSSPAPSGTVVHLLSPHGANGSTTIPDDSALAHGNGTINGSTIVSTAVTYGGNPTIRFNGGAALGWNDHADYELAQSSGDPWCIEANINFFGTAGDQFIIAKWGSLGDSSYVLYKDSSGNLNLIYALASAPSTNITVGAAAGFSTGVNYEVCANYDGNKIRVFKDGVMIASSVVGAITLVDSTTRLSFGCGTTLSTFLGNFSLNRSRVTKGGSQGYGDAGYTPQAAGYYV